MKISTRNVLKGTITHIEHGAVNTEVTIQLPGGQEIVSIITKTSAQNLELKKDLEVYGLIKASNVMIAID
ncbi:MAG: transporter [Clostridia bacterium]|nr:transporter [Clostridia bacterium]